MEEQIASPGTGRRLFFPLAEEIRELTTHQRGTSQRYLDLSSTDFLLYKRK